MRFVYLCILLFSVIVCVQAQSDIHQGVQSNKPIDFSIFNNSTIYGVEDGLPSASIRDIKEDKNGYLWLATGIGVSRFDGSNFRNFNHAKKDSSIVDIGFTRKILFNEAKDTIWILSSRSGIFYSSIDDVEFKELDEINDLFDKEIILDILLDKHENIWLGDQRNGLILINKISLTRESFSFINPNSEETDEIKHIQSIAQDDLNPDVLWLGSTKGLIRFDKITKEYEVYQVESTDNLDPNYIRLARTKNNKVYVGSWSNGLSVFNKTTREFETSFFLGGTHDIVIDNDKSVWYSSIDGFSLIDLETNELLETRLNNFESGVLRGLSFIDSRGILWYKWNRGLLKYDPLNAQTHFVELEKKDPIQQPMLIREILPWKNFYFVLSHNSKGIYKVNKENYSYELIRLPDLENKYGFCSLRDMIHMDNGNILIISTNKIVILNPNTNKIYDSPLQIDFAMPALQVLEKDDKNNYWIGSRKAGLYRLNFEDNTIVNYRSEFNTYVDDNYKWIQKLFVDSNNKLWIDSGTLSVMDLDDYSIRSLPKTDSINFFQDIANIIEYPSGKIWFSGYQYGLGSIEYKDFDKGVVQQNSSYYSNIFAFNDSIFFTLNRELGRLNINSLEQKNFNVEMHDVELLGPFLKGKNEDLVIGAVNGLLVFDLKEKTINVEVNRPIITELTSDGEIVYNGENSSLNNFILDSKTKNLGISISALGFHYPEKTTYEYKIDKNWVELNKDKRIYLSNLSSGTINLELRACNNMDVCNLKKVIYTFEILTPWYFSFLAYLAYILLLLTAVYIIYRFQISRKMALVESKRLKEINRIKTNLYANITHEFRTPLTVIHGLSETVKKDIQKNRKEKTEQSLSLIQKNSNNLLHLVNEMLDLSKIESGKMELQIRQGDVIPFMKYLGESFHSLAQSKNINLTVYAELDSLNMDYDNSKLASIVSNILSNAIKFTPQNGKVIVHINQITEEGKNFFSLKISDNGIGVSPENINNVFSRFYQVDSSISRKQEGTGIGLTLTKELVELMNGSIELISSIGKGSTFIIKIPITTNSKLFHEGVFNQENLMLNTQYNSDFNYQFNPINNKLPVVLIIEDNQDVSFYLQSCLEEKYNIIQTINGVHGVEKAIEVIPDIIISDVMMPEKDGLEVCLELKSNDLTDHIPIILLTAKSDIEDRIKGLSQGADAYMAKPFVKEELLVRLDQLISQRKKLIDKLQAGYIDNSVIDPKVEVQSVFLKKVISIIQESMSDSSFATAQLSHKLHLSESQVYRKIKAITDLSTAVFIRSIRLQKGKELIQQSDKTIAEIAYEVGFNNPTYFSKSFKEEFGFPPSELR